MNIKSSKADCTQCKLLQNESLIATTNSEKDLSKVEILFVFSHFNDIDFKNKTACSTAGNTLFYELFSKNKIKNHKYLITSSILCQIDFDIDEDHEEEYNAIQQDCCNNLFELIDACNPKIIVGFGDNIANIFNLKKPNSGSMTNMRGKIYDWKKYKVFLTFEPEFVEENKNYSSIYNKDFSKIRELLTGKKAQMKQANTIVQLGEGLQYYNIPSKFYTDEYRLIDIQYIFSSGEVLYIFRDKDNNKVYHKYKDDYYFYQCKENVEARNIVDAKDVIAYKVSWKNKRDIDPDNSYEGDIRLPIKHSIDYHLKNKEEHRSNVLNNWFCDIEIDMEGTKAFPSPEKAEHPINMISVGYHGEVFIYVLDNNTDKIKDRDDAILKIYKNEKMMLMDYIKHIKSVDPDSTSGWNFKDFDMCYIFNRLPKVGISQNSYSKFGIFNVDLKHGNVDTPGIMNFCQLELYKLFTFSTKPSYKLDSIAEEEIGIKKIQMEHSIGDMYYKDINGLIDYSIRDTVLLMKLEDKLGHINLAHELKSTCSSTLTGILSTFGQVDPLVVSYMKKRNQVSKNANYHQKKEKLAGAFVKQPVPGIYETITDFDFSSLYPSIVRTYNIGVNTFIMRLADPYMGYDMVYNRENLPDDIHMILDPLYENKLVSIKKDELLKEIDNDELICTINGCFYTNHKNEISELNAIVEYLLSSRKAYKGKMFDAKVAKDKLLENFYNTKQLVYKVIANSLYGVLAQEFFRFFNISSAGAITGSGQEAIKNSIIYADAKMESMKTGKKLIEPEVLTKDEIYGDEMPNRPTPYIITSDTDSIFCCFEDFDDHKDTTNVVKWCNEIQNYLNDDMLVSMVKRHNVEPEYNQLNLKNEFVCSKGLFLSKKHYALQLIEIEGKKVNESMHRGIETRRSDYPVKTKEMLSNLLDMILCGETVKLKHLMEFIKLQSNEFDYLLRSGDLSVMKSISFAKELKEYKNMPQNITAMMNWNDLMFDSFKHGDRGYLVKVKGINEEKAPEDVIIKYHTKFIKNGRKLDVIALPETEKEIPNYFILDIPPMKKVVFEDRWQKMLQPLIEVDRQNKSGLMTL
jgi:DNA polymerase elongation subunit (family B)